MDLRQYEQQKFALAEVLRAASNVVSADHRDLHDRIQNLFERLADDRFNLVVVGRFNRGKTSLMNAILATDRLPTGIVPLTSVITTVVYGSRERVVLGYDARILTKEISIEALPQFITQAGNPENVQRIRTAEVQIPAEILRRGFYFVDTPGLGSAIVENTRTTESFFPEADAFLLVTGYESPLSEEELRFFRAASAWGRRIFVVLNKHDTIPASERKPILTFVSERLQDILGGSAPKLFSVSALHGLRAKQSHNDELLTASGMRTLEEQLIEFLLMEKSEQLLIAMCDRVSDLLRDIPSPAEKAGLLAKTEELSKQLRGEGSAAPFRVSTKIMTQFLGLHQTESCEICRYVREHIWSFLSQYQYDLVVSAQAQQNFAKRRGFCPFHTWEYETLASPYGTCNGYPGLLDRLAAELHAAAVSESNHDRLLSAMNDIQPSNADCSLCRERNEAETDAINSVASRLVNDEGGSVASLSAPCLPHLLMLSARLQNVAMTKMLMQRQAELFRRISDDMKRNTLKIDAARRYLATDEETAAAKRALLAVVGFRNVNFDCWSRLPGVVNLTKRAAS